MFSSIKIFTLFFLVFGCTSDRPDPEIFFKDYINYRFLKVPDKETLDKMSSGPYNVFVNGLDDSQMNKIDLSQKYKLIDQRIIYKKFFENSCYLAYELKYSILNNPSGGNPDIQSVRKIATLSFDGKDWKIHDVENVKTDLVMVDEINLN